ncbi:MAG: hypothetical protein AB1690_03570 [Candidatus Zixiibacteriota bacterium]
MSSNPRQSRAVIILLVIVVLMAAEIFYLSYQNSKLRAMIDDPSRLLRTLNPDDAVPSVRTQDINGVDFSLRFGPEEPATLLLWFSPGCSHCESNFEYWEKIYQRHDDTRLRMAGFCAGNFDEARQLAMERDIKYPVLAVTDPYITETFKGNVLPQTVLISPEGIIKRVWPGEHDDQARLEIDSALVSLSAFKNQGGESK